MSYFKDELMDGILPRAAAYRALLSTSMAHESAQGVFSYSERHLQALWFDDSLRPQFLQTSRGEPVVVENAGRWNLEAGPDFLGAVLLVGRERRRISGDVEVHIVSKDWKNHGHHVDPRYANVRMHITWVPSVPDESLFAPGTVHISLRDHSLKDLAQIDPMAYPFHAPYASTVFPWAGEHPDDITLRLEGAGEERLRQKAVRLAQLIDEQGEAQALYEEGAVVLGYKKNKAPFRTLVQRAPLASLAQYGKDWESVYSVLLGLSGLLPKQASSRWPAASRRELRLRWDCWWREQHKWEEVEPLGRADWDLSGLRPLNHPIRRLCALAQWVAFGCFDPEGILSLSHFKRLDRCFWSTHIGWAGTEQNAELIGPGRLQAMEQNVFTPYRLLKGDEIALIHLRAEPMNSVIRETAYTLFGPDHSPKLYRTALARQGLIQLFNDFVLTGRLAELK